MKMLEVGKLHRGELFAVAGHKYVVLDFIGSGVLALESDAIRCRPFGRNNNFSESDIFAYLNEEYLDELVANGLDHEKLLLQTVDLKATDGSREYGYWNCRVALFTMEQYFKYNEYIPHATEDAWWTATPWKTPKDRSPFYSSSANVLFINPYGLVGNLSTANTSISPRPALVFSYDLLVSVTDKTEKKKFDVRIEQTLEGIVEIEADSADEAEEIARKLYETQGHEFPDMDDCDCLRFHVLKSEDEYGKA